ncbi:unnamed protein product [Caenorhabditis nigoni]
MDQGPKILTRLSSICVLEYLSFDKRLYLVSRIPGFRKVEKSLPLHLDYLKILSYGIQIDQHKYYLSRRLQDFDPTGTPTRTFELRKMQIETLSVTFLGFVSPIDGNIQKAYEKLVYDLIGNRPWMFTKKLEVRDSWIHGEDDPDRIVYGPRTPKKLSTRIRSFENVILVRNSEKIDFNTEIRFPFIEKASDDSPFLIHLKIQPSGTATPKRLDCIWKILKTFQNLLWKIPKIFTIDDPVLDRDKLAQR